MADEKDETTHRPTPTPALTEKPTMLAMVAPTDPAILKAIEDARLSNAHYAALGRIAAQWAYFEAVVDTWTHTFANVEPEIGICFTGQMIGPRPRVDAFIALARHCGAKSKWNDKLEKFAQNAQRIGEDRNRALHDVWRLDNPSQPIRIEATARKTVCLRLIPVSTEELKALAERIDKLTATFDGEIAGPIFTEIHMRASPDKSP